MAGDNPYATTSLPPEPNAPTGVPSQDERTWGMLAHLSGLIASLLAGFSFLGPLIIWVIKKDQSAFVADQAKEALNFQIAVTLAFVISGVSTLLFCVGIVLLPIVFIAAVVFAIQGAMEANKGVSYRYPYTIRFIP